MRVCNNLPQPNPYILVFGGCGRLLHTLTPTRSALQFLARCHPYILLHFYTCYISGNENSYAYNKMHEIESVSSTPVLELAVAEFGK